MSTAADIVTVILVAVGASVAGIQVTWRGAALGLGLQYVGVVVHLLLTSGVVVGLAAAVVAAGVEALLLADERGRFSLRRRTSPRPDDAAADTSETSLPADSSPTTRGEPSRNGPSGDSRRPWFDLSVVGLAVVGAAALALSRPLTGNVASDAIVNILTLTGLLYCLLGQPVRVASGLLLVTSAGNVLLRAADPNVTPGETLLFAIAQMALALALVQWRATAGPIEQPS